MNIEQLAREAGLGYAGPHHPGATQGGLRYFHALSIEAEHKRLLEGSGEPVACIHKGFMYMAHEFMSGIPKDADKLYTSDQLAAAVLRGKREATIDAYLLVKLLRENSTEYIIDRLSDMVEATEPRGQK